MKSSEVNNKPLKKKTGLAIGILIFAAILAGLFSFYVSDYYKATEYADRVLASTEIEVEILKDMTVFKPADEEGNVGLIFYPGGKVEYSAYAPLMEKLAGEGICCYLLKMPFNLAVFDLNAADKVLESTSDIDKWYICGHSLGGAVAAIYFNKHQDDYAGLILLGAYSVKDLSQSDIRILSVYGSNDEVLNLENYQNNRDNLNGHTIEAVIDGGCHSFFGAYGQQKGDGIAEITNEEQIEITGRLITEFINE